MSDDMGKLTIYQAQHLGTRDDQEDALGCTDTADENLIREKGCLAVLADGMGGLSNGRKASQAAVSKFLHEHPLREPGEAAPLFLQRTLRIANISVFDKAFQDGREVELGTTLVAALIESDSLYWISVGDSCIYHYREGRLQQLNTEHVYGNHLKIQVENGEITQEEASSHPERDYLTSYLGMAEIPEVDSNQEPLSLRPGDRVLLCSDGLSNVLKKDELEEILSKHQHDPATEMIKQVLAQNKRHQDNVTVIIIECQ